jgi:multidrug efflux system outer membrane protein
MPSLQFLPRAGALSAATLILLGVAACTTVGPDYAGAPDVAAKAVAAKTFARTPEQVASAPPAAAWWRELGDAQLDRLVDLALASSPDVHVAQARLRQARASLDNENAKRMPTSSATAAAVGVSEGPGTASSTSLHLYTIGADASWEADLFGGTRRAIEAAGAESDAVVADLADARVSLAAEVVQAYAGLRDQQQRLALLRTIAAIDHQRLALEQQRRDRGVDSALDLERLLTQAEASDAALTGVQAQIAASLDELAGLTGQEPGALDAELAAPSALPTLPARVDVGDPAGLLARRPDIRAAERRLASHNAQIGEKKAGYFPKLSLFGDIGFSATEPSHLLRQSSLTGLGIPYLTWNVLDFGRTAAAVRQADAGRDEYAERYRGTVLAALRDANTSLSNYGYQRENVRRLLAQQESAQRSETLSVQRRASGADSLMDLLTAQRVAANAKQQTISAQADLIKDFAALQKSLGLGWEAAPAS